jgi:Multiubiquitin
MTDTTHEDHQSVIEVLVNDKPVTIRGRMASGEQIKRTAIEQGVHIELDFFLWEELSDGGVHQIENHETVDLGAHRRFTAVPHDHHEVTVTVNEMPVKIKGRSATGSEIKAAAIAQGVLIQPNFVLQEELPNGTSRVVGDHDCVHLREHLRFTAIAPDDNS